MNARPLICGLALLCATASVLGQAVPTATGGGAAQVGAAVSVDSPDYGPRYIQGISVFGDLDLGEHLGIEADAHLVSLITPTDIGQNTFLAGPRYSFHRRRLAPYIKALAGVGLFEYQYDYLPHYHDSYFVYAFGGGLDVHATRHIVVRAIDFEAQRWPSYPTSGLTPYVTSFGVAYAFR